MEPLQMIGEASKAFPFMLAVGQDARINKTRLFESAITAAISGALIAAAGYYVALPVLQKEVLQIKLELADLKVEIRDAVKETKAYQNDRRNYRDQAQEKTDAKIQAIQVEMAKRHRP
jgi:hypothetical protein